MRESNFAFPSQNRASVCITSALYDRRALDCTAILPLINSLTHLTYLTSTSPRIREILTMDGGLERLIRILKTTKVNDKRSGWKWTMAFQCVANVGVRGSETIRTRVVDAGMVPVIITVLDNFLKALNHVRLEKEHHHHQQQMLAAAQLLTQNTQMIQSPAPSIPMTTTSTTTTYVGNLENNAITSTNRFLPNVTTTYEIRSSDDARSDVASWGSVGDNDESSTITAGTSNATLSPSLRSTTTTTTTTHLNPANNTTTTITTITNPSNSSPSSTTSSSSVLEIDVLYREEDILLSLQLLAYLSKYPHIRTIFHSAYPPHNVFSLVERFTHRLHPAEIQYWAGVIMRNACRKDEARGGVRQCAYMACGKWESYAREFAKCRRCRKAKYCSKACQSKAWSEGHRWWCMERHSHADTSATTDNTNNTNNNNNNSNNNNNNNNSNNSNNNNSNTNQNINNNNNNNNNGHSITFGQSTTDTNNTNGTNSTNSSSNDNNDATSLNSGSGSGSGSILVSLS